MSGWRRLWIVASLLCGIPAAYFTYDATRVTRYQEGWQVGKTDQRVLDGWAIGENCDLPSVWFSNDFTGLFVDRTSNSTRAGFRAKLECRTKGYLGQTILAALLPGLLMALIGLTIRWVFRGFRPVRRREEEKQT